MKFQVCEQAVSCSAVSLSMYSRCAMLLLQELQQSALAQQLCWALQPFRAVLLLVLVISTLMQRSLTGKGQQLTVMIQV